MVCVTSPFTGKFSPCPSYLRANLHPPELRRCVMVSVPTLHPSMFSPATPHLSALAANVPSNGFIATQMNSTAGLSAVLQPRQSAASGVAGSVAGSVIERGFPP